MDALQTNDNFPWELIVSALQGTLTPAEEPMFREWLGMDQRNADHFQRLQQMWSEGLRDYAFYEAADETSAWDNLQQKIGKSLPFVARRPIVPIGRWAAVAASVLLLAGAAWWFTREQNKPGSYETASEQQKLALPDGSMVTIGPRTKIRVAGDYNKGSRTVVLESGKAEFSVAHGPQSTFTVDMDVASVSDIGTEFSIQRTKDSIVVSVSSGKIAFVEKETGESRQVGAGASLVYYPHEHRFGETEPGNDRIDAMRFKDTPLSVVITAMEGVYHKKITLNDPSLGQKRLTADLTGLDFADAIKIVCASLNLAYTEANGNYLLKPRDDAGFKH